MDIDVDDGATAIILRDLAVECLGAAPVRTRDGVERCALVYAAAEGQPRKRVLAGAHGKVEVLGHGQQLVMYGSHPSGGMYRMPALPHRMDLPRVTEKQIQEFLTAVAPWIGADPSAITTETQPTGTPRPSSGTAGGRTAGITDVAAALALISNDGPADWDRWTRIGLTVWASTAGSEEGFAAFDGWSSTHSAYDPDATRARWDQITASPPIELGFGSLMHEARKVDPNFRRPRPRVEAQDEFEATEDAPASRGQPRQDNSDLSEDGLALAFCADHEGQAIFNHSDQAWLRWSGSHWRADGVGETYNSVRVFIRGVRECMPKAPDGLGRIRLAGDVLKAAAADPRMAVASDRFNLDPFALGTPGGVVDLRTGKLRSGVQRDYITKQAGVTPAAPGTAAPGWQRFLSEATGGDLEMETFLRRFAGYCLTGDVSEEVIVFLYGAGTNGKGVFLRTLRSVIGSYAVTAPAEMMATNSRVNPEYHRATLFGARLVTASETEAGADLAEAFLKEITGNEAPLPARAPYGRPFEFRSQAKVLLVSNHAPQLRGRSPAMERRLRVVPFNSKPQVVDEKLKDRLGAELPAILRWAIDGCLEWQTQGLGTCAAIRAASGEYLAASDTLGDWMEEGCDVGPGFTAARGVLLSDFNIYAQANGAKRMSGGEFLEALGRVKGIRATKKNGSLIWDGIRLKEADGGELAVLN